MVSWSFPEDLIFCNRRIGEFYENFCNLCIRALRWPILSSVDMKLPKQVILRVSLKYGLKQ